MNNKLIRTLMLLMVISLPSICFARTITVQGYIYDILKAKHLPNSKVRILTPDSVLVTETIADNDEFESKANVWNFVKTGKYTVQLKDSIQNYILEASHENYEPSFVNIDLTTLGKKEYEMTLPPIYLSPQGKTTELDDVVVKATKIKFFHKGDTIVYNADAFQLPEGSMLDALIAQLPGVEIKDGGKIYVNGKYVESMLLNGKDFFKGNQKVLRENIGAYTVKSVEVYDKYKEMSTLLGKQIEGDSEYVMDVKLKKDYMTGFMGNIEAGYGTHGRYNGRLFTMLFNNVSNFGLYANVNNLNNLHRPSNGYVGYVDAKPGVTEVANGGFDYNVEDQKKVWSVGGNINAMYTDYMQKSNQLSEFYIQKTFESTFGKTRNYDLSLSTNHIFRYQKPMYYLRIDPEFRYDRSIGNNNSLSATFNENVQERYDLDAKLIEALYGSGNPEDIKQAIVNRNNFIKKNRSNTWYAHLYNEDSFKIPKSPDAITVWIEGRYERQHSSSTATQLIDYGYNNSLSQPLSSLARQSTTINYPYYDFYAKGAARYFINRKDLSYSFCYEFRHEQTRKTNEEYLFEAMADNQEALIPDIYTEIADLPNTSRSKLFNNIHKFKGKINYKKPNMFKQWRFETGMQVEYHLMGRHLDYMGYAQSPADQTVNPVFIPVSRFSGDLKDCYAFVQIVDPTSLYKYVSLRYTVNTNYAPLFDMITLPNTSDPLNIYTGNPDLKNALVQTISLTSYAKLTKKTTIHITQDFSHTGNDIARGYIYDTQTGVKEYKSFNTSGVIRNTSYIGYYQTIGPSDHFEFNANVSYNFYRYANMIGVDGPAVKQRIYNNNLIGRIGLQYVIRDKLRIGVDENYNMMYSHSAATANRTQGLATGGMIWYDLPFGLQINANYNFIKMFGLADKSMKDSYHMLSADLSYTLNDHWSFRLTASDILNAGSVPTPIVNSTGRTETFVNTLPRYFMATVSYKFNTQKKK